MQISFEMSNDKVLAVIRKALARQELDVAECMILDSLTPESMVVVLRDQSLVVAMADDILRILECRVDRKITMIKLLRACCPYLSLKEARDLIYTKLGLPL